MDRGNKTDRIDMKVQSKSLKGLHYLEFNPGGKQAVVLLHGLGATAESWMMQVPELTSRDFRVLCPDIPGFGKSGWPGGRWSVGAASKLAAGWLDAIVDDPYDLVGISMGGVFAMYQTIHFPNHIRRLVLVNTFARLSTGNIRQWIYFARRYYLVARYGLKAQADLVARRIFPADDQEIYRKTFTEQILTGNERVYRQALQSLGLINLEKHLNQIKCPVMIVSGENDSTVPISVQNRLARKIPGSEHVLIADAGHAVVVDQASIFNQHLLDFLTAA